ncbi:MAG: hypothetical protein AAGF12_36290 [Myxococcota bacterium]
MPGILEPGAAYRGAMSDTTDAFHIGVRADCCNQAFLGRIDELKVRNVVRSAEEICGDAGLNFSDRCETP